HTYATLLISEGAHPRVVMDRMGHSSIQITMNTYGHLFPSEDEATINGLDRAFRQASLNVSRPPRGLSAIAQSA
ncbi:MAG: tyrosine-type recombinase/integrase, partial [Acidimicrobiales bacterium]|nr:tyrosine-type recombinase/integrase [Acidimicrobiales bacterium]